MLLLLLGLRWPLTLMPQLPLMMTPPPSLLLLLLLRRCRRLQHGS
jgi:hypothetical protein